MGIRPVFCFPHLEKHAAPSEDTKSGKALLTQETGQMGRGSWWAVTGVGGVVGGDNDACLRICLGSNDMGIPGAEFSSSEEPLITPSKCNNGQVHL